MKSNLKNKLNIKHEKLQLNLRSSSLCRLYSLFAVFWVSLSHETSVPTLPTLLPRERRGARKDSSNEQAARETRVLYLLNRRFTQESVV